MFHTCGSDKFQCCVGPIYFIFMFHTCGSDKFQCCVGPIYFIFCLCSDFVVAEVYGASNGRMIRQ